MSPLGTLEISSSKNHKSLFNYNHHHHNTNHHLSPMYCVGGPTNATPSVPTPTTNDHLVKLMSLSLVNSRGPSVALNLSPSKNFLYPHPILNLPDPTSSPSFTEMLLKSGHLPGGSPIQIPSPNSSGSGHPESPRSTADTGMTPPPPISSINISTTVPNDDDEVLSIGRDDDHQALLDCDSDDEDIRSSTKDFNNLSGAMINDDNHSQGSLEEYDDLGDDRSSQTSSESHHIRRDRKYSSEDSFTIKSLCSPTTPNNYHHSTNSNDTTTSTASPPPPSNSINSILNGTSNSTTNGSRHSSLIFSIANILRPDFGLCNPTTTTSPFAPGKSLKSPPSILDFNYNSKRSHSQKGGPGRVDSVGINPIDLSRPSSTGSHHTHHHNHNHHHQNQHKISSSGRGGNSNGNSKRLKLSSESPSSLTKGNSHSNIEKNNSSSNSNNNNNNNNSSTKDKSSSKTTSDGQTLWPAWVYCTRYSDRPSSGPRARRMRKNKEEKAEVDEKRPRTAFTAEQLARLKKEFDENRYLTEKRRQDLAKELRLHENQIKIWFQNKRAKLKKATGTRGGLALQLMAQGLYNHSTIKGGPDDDDDSD